MKRLYSVLITIGITCFASGQIVTVSNDYFQGTGFFADGKVLEIQEETDPIPPILEYRDTCIVDSIRDTVYIGYPTIYHKDSLHYFVLSVKNGKPCFHYRSYDSICQIGHPQYTDVSLRAIHMILGRAA